MAHYWSQQIDYKIAEKMGKNYCLVKIQRLPKPACWLKSTAMNKKHRTHNIFIAVLPHWHRIDGNPDG